MIAKGLSIHIQCGYLAGLHFTTEMTASPQYMIIVNFEEARPHHTHRMTARVIPTILRSGSQRGFTRVKLGKCRGEMTLAVSMKIGSYRFCWCEWVIVSPLQSHTG